MPTPLEQVVPQLLECALEAVQLAEEAEAKVAELKKQPAALPVVRLEKVAAEEVVSNLARAGLIEPSRIGHTVQELMDNPLKAAAYLNKVASVLASAPHSAGYGVTKESSAHSEPAASRETAESLWDEAIGMRG